MARRIAQAGHDVAALNSGPVCDETLLGGGVLGAMRPGSLLVVMRSIPVATARRQAEAAAEKGIGHLDAPVSGGEKGSRGQVVDRLFEDTVAHGDGELDHSATIREIGRQNGLSVA